MPTDLHASCVICYSVLWSVACIITSIYDKSPYVRHIMQDIAIKFLTFFLQKHVSRIKRNNRTGTPITAASFLRNFFFFQEEKIKCKLITQKIIASGEDDDTSFQLFIILLFIELIYLGAVLMFYQCSIIVDYLFRCSLYDHFMLFCCCLSGSLFLCQ